jgi:hypothetical protein
VVRQHAPGRDVLASSCHDPRFPTYFHSHQRATRRTSVLSRCPLHRRRWEHRPTADYAPRGCSSDGHRRQRQLCANGGVARWATAVRVSPTPPSSTPARSRTSGGPRGPALEVSPTSPPPRFLRGPLFLPFPQLGVSPTSSPRTLPRWSRRSPNQTAVAHRDLEGGGEARPQ